MSIFCCYSNIIQAVPQLVSRDFCHDQAFQLQYTQ